jgi:geranylgeranyl diphosphate/geranylgeranyl-bacteriochlorophyllide a reductase
VEHRVDIGIVGAGPAGARAAELLAAGGARVLMLDPKAPWEKPCGGGLTAGAFHAIPALRELEPLAQPVTSVRVETAADTGVTVPLDHPMWMLSRRTLARWQLDRALRAGAEHLPVRVREARRAGGGWRLDTTDGTVVAPFLLGADGAASLVRRAAAPGFDVELAPTRVAYPEGSGPHPDTVILRFYAGLAGYLWDFPRPTHRSVGVVVPNRTWQRPRMDGEIDEYRVSNDGCVCPGLDRAGAVIGTAWLGHGDYTRIAGRDFALLGDAAGFADPFTGEGIQNALRSAELFARAFTGSGVGAYPALARRAFEREFQVARLLRRLLFDEGAGLELVDRSLGSKGWCALVATLMNAMNEHDGRIAPLVARWARAWASLRRVRGAPRTVRPSAPCACACRVTEGDPPGRRNRPSAA